MRKAVLVMDMPSSCDECRLQPFINAIKSILKKYETRKNNIDKNQLSLFN